jgi:hypothetical protein
MKMSPNRIHHTRGAPLWWFGHPDIGPAEFTVLMCLLRHADRHGICWVGQARIGGYFRRSRAWANAALRNLEEAGLVRIDRRRGGDGRDETCIYRLMGQDGTAWQGGILAMEDAPIEGQDVPERYCPDPSFVIASPPDRAEPVPAAVGSRAGTPSQRADTPGNPAGTPCQRADTNLTHFNDSDSLSLRDLRCGVREGKNEGIGNHRGREGAPPAEERSASLTLERPAPPALDWMPRVEDVAWALRTIPDLDVDRHTERFVLSCRAKGYAYRDPSAAWRRWLIEPKTELPKRHGQTRHNYSCSPSGHAADGSSARQETRHEHGTPEHGTGIPSRNGAGRNFRTRNLGGSDLHRRNLARADDVYGRIMARRAGNIPAGCHARA